MINELGRASIAHADTVAHAIKELEGRPDWSFEPFPQDKDLMAILEIQLQNEKKARALHREAAEATENGSMSDRFMGRAREEQDHIRTVEKILSNLSAAQK